jgi:hypothetical protein
VSSAPDVHDWARARGLDVIDDPGSLDEAAAAGRAWVEARGRARAVIAHADLPLARTLSPLARDGRQPIVAGLGVRVLRHAELAFDVDVPDDLDRLDHLAWSLD